MLRSNLCHYNDAYILVQETTSVPCKVTQGVDPVNTNKKVILKNCAQLIDFTSAKNNTEIDHGKDTDVVMPIYNFI